MIWKSLTAFLLIDTCVAISPITDTKYGFIEGVTITTFNGKKVDAYLGVPYAVPPTGRNRFAAPRPPRPWNETIKTQSVSKSCIQPVSEEMKKATWFMYEGPESEDCLYLNVWKPNDSSEDKLPVMVWIHGGGYLAGSASDALYDGGILATENDVVVVSMNYRLAMFGFFYLNSSKVPGNAGIQDQILAIKWVNENIQNFGGDPTRVTLFGESVGGTCVSFHLVNPYVSNLFQYAILQTGTMLQDILSRTESDVLKTSLQVAGNMGCLHDDMENMLECLRAKPAEEVAESHFGFPQYVRLAFAPVRNGVEVPIDLRSAVEMVPKSERPNLLNLNCPVEAIFLTPSLFPGKFLTEDLSVDEKELRVLLQNYFNLNDERTQDIIMHEYRDFRAPYNKSQLRIPALDAVSDSLFICPGIDFTKSWVTEENQVFFLHFERRPSRPIKNPIPAWVGTSHGDEIPFVFGAPLDPENGYTTAEAELSLTVMKYWTNFAKSGNPNVVSKIGWPPVEPNSDLTYLAINENGTESQTFLKERECNFWANIYPHLLTLEESSLKAQKVAESTDQMVEA